MRLTDLNAAGGIGANCLLADIGPFRLLVDAGLHPKLVGLAALPRFERLGDRPPDLVLLSHCHLDHLGALPVLLRGMPDVPVIMSPASRILYRRLLHNSHNVMERQRAEAGIREYPLFTRAEIERIDRQVFALTPRQPRFFSGLRGDRLTLTLHPAGHIPGAVAMLVEYHHRRILFSGDVLFNDQLIMPGAALPGEPVDTLVMETTRGATARANGSRADEMARLLATIREVTAHGGHVLLPVFALGRMQEMLALLHDARARGILPGRLPVYASGLGLDLVDYFDEIARHTGACSFRRRLVRELGVTRLPESHRPGRQGPAIYLLSSGMMVPGTPSHGIAAALLGEARNAICFVGYCDPDTPGGQLLAARRGEPFVFPEIPKTVELRCRIEKFDLSSHADRDELLAWAAGLTPRAVVLTHGDPPARQWFADALAALPARPKVVDPVPLRTVEV